MSRGHVLKNSDGGEFPSVLSGSAVLCGRFQYFIVVYWFVQEKKIKTNNQKNSKQAKPTKQTRENSDKLFLTALSIFLFMFCRRLIFGRIMSAACFRCCLAEVKILLSRCLRVYECSLSMQIMSGKTWFFWAILLVDNHTTHASCVMPNNSCLVMTSVMLRCYWACINPSNTSHKGENFTSSSLEMSRWNF